MPPQRPALLFLLLLLLTQPPPAAAAFHVGQWRTLLSLSHSLLTRVANARAARGDLPGADRAHKIADHLHSLTGAEGIWSLGWTFAWNYLYGAGLPSADTSRAAAALLAALGEAYRMDSAAERAAWAVRNHARLRSLAAPLFQSSLRAFSRSGPLREAVLVLQREVSEGELLRDCFEVGAGDLKGLLRVAKGIFSSEAYGHAEL